MIIGELYLSGSNLIPTAPSDVSEAVANATEAIELDAKTNVEGELFLCK